MSEDNRNLMDSIDRQIQSAKDIATIKTQVMEMHRLLIGNGEPGVVNRVHEIEVAMAKQVGIVAGASAVVSLVVSVLGWKVKSWMGHP